MGSLAAARRGVICVAIALVGLLGGCAAQAPVGQWFGPTTPTTFTVQPVPNIPTARLFRTPHYDIYTTIQDDDLTGKLCQLMEGSLVAYHTLAPDVRLTTYPMQCYIFAKRAEWAEFTVEHCGGEAGAYLKINRGGYTRGDWYVAYYIGESSTLSVAAHEGWHQFVARHFKGRLPPFIEEGLATMFEGVEFHNGLPQYNLSINQDRAIALRKAIDDDDLWPLEQVIGMHAGQVLNQRGAKIDAFYAQAWGMGRFLWDGDNQAHRAALQQLLADTARGKVYDPTGTLRFKLRPWHPWAVKPMLEHYLGMSFDQIEASYDQFIRSVAYDELPLISAGGG